MNRSICVFLAIGLTCLIACESEQAEPVADCSVSELSLELSEHTDADCGASNGSALLTATGGEGNLVFSFSGSEQQEGLFEGLAAGTHNFTVTDENGCSETLTVNIGNVEGVMISSVDVVESGCKTNNGTITVTASEGTAPYQYKLNQGSFQGENTFEGLSTGSHTVVVVDEAGCEFAQEVEVLSGISFGEHVSPIISENCAVSGCHNGTAGIPDFRTFGAIQANAAQIKSLTGDGTMPQNGTLTQAQIDMIACWVDDGALDN